MKSCTRKNSRQNRRYFLLLEILIAFVLVTLCAVPLLRPHVYAYRVERRFVDEVELDRYVGNIYVRIREDLHRNRWSWEEIEKGVDQAIPGEWLDPLPYHGRYSVKKGKRNKEKAIPSYHLLDVRLEIHSTASGKESGAFDYDFAVFVERLGSDRKVRSQG